ncbi:MAG: DUF6263 family protein [Ferruginibacter sp.]
MSFQKENFLMLILMGLLILAGCKRAGNNNTYKGVAKNEDGKTYIFQLHLIAGEQYNYTTSNETVTIVEVNKEQITSTNNSTVGLLYRVLVSTPDSIVLKATYQGFHVIINAGNEKQVIDADNAEESGNPAEKILAGIKGSSLLITLNKKGIVTNISGAKTITDKIMSGLNIYNDEATKQKIMSQLSKLVGDEFIKNNIESAFNFFPDGSVAVGDSWQHKKLQPGEINFEASITYTLDGVEDDMTAISVNSSMKTGKTSANLMGQQVNANITGTMVGSFEVDRATGMLSTSTSTTKLEGYVQVMAKEIPIEITTKKKLQIKRL